MYVYELEGIFFTQRSKGIVGEVLDVVFGLKS